MSEHDTPMEDAQAADLERLLLDEPSASEQIASMKASIDTLVGTVKEIAQKSALQVRVSQVLMLDKLQTFRDMPTIISSRIKESLPAETRQQIEDIFGTLFERDFKALERELDKLNSIYERLHSISSVVEELVPVSLSEQIAQAEHDDSCMRELALLLNVDSTEVVDQVKALMSSGLPKSVTNRSVSPFTGDYAFQGPLQSTASSSAASNPAVIEQLNRFEFDNLEYHATFDPIAAAQGEERTPQCPTQGDGIMPPAGLSYDTFQLEKRNKPPQKQKECCWTETRPTTKVQGGCYDQPLGSIQGVEMARMFAALTLPDVQKYSDPNGRQFGEFLAQFRLKYQGLGLENDMLVHLLFSKLDGFPRSVAEALPRSIKEAGFDAIIEALRGKFKENESSAQMNAYMKLKTLRKEGDVTGYCVELEKITQKAYPEASDQELSRTRASELVAQLSDWPEYLQLYTTMELAPKEHAYEMVKSLAQRCERSRALAIATKKTVSASKSQRSVPEERRPLERTRPRFSQKQEVPRVDTVTEDKDGRRLVANKGARKCNKCQEYGHFSRDCKKSGGTKSQALQNEGSEPNRPCVLTASSSKCTGTTDVTPSRCEGLVGERMTTTVKLLGLSRTALLDTGSQISIIPREVLRAGELSGFHLDEDVEEFSLENQEPIYDASGNQMKFEGAVRLTLQLEDGERRRIMLFVRAKGDDTIVLGTNALQALGISLLTKNRSHTHEQNHDKAQTATRSKPRCKKFKRQKNPSTTGQAVVTERVYLRPGETKMLPIRCTKSEQEGILWSKSSLVPDVICHRASHSLNIPVTNDFAGAKIFREGEEVGTYEPAKIVEAEPVQSYGDMLERTALTNENREGKLLRLLYSNKNAKQKEGLDDLVRSYSDVFAVSEQELSQTTLVEHSIETGDAKPIKQRARPVPLGTKVELREILTDLQKRKVIEPSKSSWASPIVLVQKKDGTLRLCVDYRKVNQVTKTDSYPLPNIDTILQSMKGKKTFSTLDLSSGYWQISLSQDAKEKSAFITTEGLYQFRVLPFGLAASPATFQRLMHIVLGPLLDDEVFCYLDDIMVATDSVERHLKVMEDVFKALRKAGLRLNPRKCVLMEEKVEFLGHVIDGDGLNTDPKKVEAINKYPLPQTRADLRSFLGMCSYYRKFVLGFSKVAAPLHEMTSEKKDFVWTPSAKEAFERLKKIITEAPVLAQPDVEAARSGKRPFKIHTDASTEGLGAVLSQEGEDGLLHPIFFASKGLSKCEKNYHVTDLEALAVVFALRKFHMFVYGLHIEVFTDHQALTALFKRSNVSARILRWALELQKYDIKMIYLKGAANKVADALSRGAVPQEDPYIEEPMPNELIVGAMQKEQEWTAELREHSVYGKVIEDLDKGHLDNDVIFPGVARKYKVADFEMDQGKLVLLENELRRMVVPPSQRKEVFEEAHAGLLAGHFGPKKLIRQLSKRLFWESLSRDVAKWSQECRKCFCHNAQPSETPPLKPIVTSKPYEIVGIDVLEMGQTSSGNRYILTVIDHFSKYGGAYAIPNKAAETVARVFFEKWVAEGCRQPKCVLSDQGGEFDNKMMQELRKILGIEHVFTKGHNPRENGITERFNQTVVQMLRKKVQVPSEWDKILPYCVFAYNTSVHESTGESPFFLLHGFDAHVPWDSVPDTPVSEYTVDLDSYVHELAVGTQVAREYARDVNDRMRSRMKSYYDRKNRVRKSTLNTGDRVYLKIPSERHTCNPKLTNPWEGPYRIISVSENSALITLIGKNKEPVRVPFDVLRKLPAAISNEPTETQKSRGKRGRPRKKTSHSLPITCNEILVSRTLLGVDHPLNLRHRCQCGLFGQMAHVALPGLTHPMARSKKVEDMFQLANVASIAEQACWGEERKEEELRKKNSSYITPYGLALAVDAHRRRCHAYAEAVESARGQRFDHPAVFPWTIPCDLGAHLTTAIALQGKLRIPGANTDNEPEIFIALPQAFARVNADVDYGRNVTPYVYADWSTLAQKLITRPIVTSIIVVWPDTTPESRHMRQVLIALERHLQSGGSLAFFPSPYEDDNEAEWMHMGRVCAEYVRYMTDPHRAFDAIVRDHYSNVLEGAPYTHPAGCLGTHPRRGRCQFGAYQIRLFLDKLRLTVNDLIKMDEFEIASAELRERRQKEKEAQRRRRREERMPNFFVIQDPTRVRHSRPISFRRPTQDGGRRRSRERQRSRRSRNGSYSRSRSRRPEREDRPCSSRQFREGHRSQMSQAARSSQRHGHGKA